ncbi:MAG: hypothetical protein AB1555_12610 [Nitrospirota bacterium]
MKDHEAPDPLTVGLLGVAAQMSGAGGKTHLIEEQMVSRNGRTDDWDTCRHVMVSAVEWTKSSIDFRRLSGEEGQQVCDDPLRVRCGPMLLLLCHRRPATVLTLATRSR